MPDYLAAFWNLENLFAPEGFPAREPWIAKKNARDLKGWTQALFDRKIDQLASIIVQMGGGAGPDLLGVCEVENRFALEALSDRLDQLLPGRNYSIVHADSTKDKRGIDTAFIYDKRRLAVIETEIFSHFVMRRTGTRDITQCTFVTNSGNQFVALSNHWPSRSGGTVESAGYRMTAGETLGYWHERIREERSKDVAVIAMGDMNDDPSDASVMVHANARRERDDVEGSTSAMFYNLTWNLLRQTVTSKSGRKRTLYGTLYFKGDGNLFDQILVSRSLLKGNTPFKVLEDTVRIEAYPEMTSNSKNEGPVRFGMSKGNAARNVNTDGFSDHFPVSVVVREKIAGA
ncbi:endonuclease/exonuclease/phosphatase family protein [uncultured Hoeflea sp.]|uniref:endonuclease/exonuclease/phosphatase family protein n=1 Tax=uncultured Hoeflea sp. TaxID=538666 RepID=UPI002603045A|nr:endonuclease/exonuclease/phosphatase family protein [uncultured Hoeflea sp.]